MKTPLPGGEGLGGGGARPQGLASTLASNPHPNPLPHGEWLNWC